MSAKDLQEGHAQSLLDLLDTLPDQVLADQIVEEACLLAQASVIRTLEEEHYALETYGVYLDTLIQSKKAEEGNEQSE